jgi:trans-aconitate 2-methyltransferase
MSSSWDPDQYLRFAAERRRPFDDLLGLLEPGPGGRVVDLGCGTGELTIELHQYLEAAETLGIDDAETMLERARAHLADDGARGVHFECAHLEDYAPAEPVDVVFANASLQWVPDHPRLLAHLSAALAPGGQLAFQVPANHDHPSHTIAQQLGDERDLVTTGGAANVLALESYALVLNDLALVDLHVRLQVYGFTLASSADVVEWTKGTLLTGYRAQLDAEAYEDFEREYATRLRAELGDGPYFYAFKRILARARRSGRRRRSG